MATAPEVPCCLGFPAVARGAGCELWSHWSHGWGFLLLECLSLIWGGGAFSEEVNLQSQERAQTEKLTETDGRSQVTEAQGSLLPKSQSRLRRGSLAS